MACQAAFGDLKEEIQENLKQYRNKQPVLDLEQQLAGKLVNVKVMDTLKHKGSIALQYLTVINTMLTVPGITVKAEYQCWINAINVMTVFCPPVSDGNDDIYKSGPPAKQPRHVLEDDTEIALHQAMESVRCNICGMELLAWKADLLNYAEICHRTVVQG
ncbi:hypothetical protein BJX76DRAFT_347371 [Aspergillus varians]